MSEIVVDTKRVLDAPRERVWECFADPERLAVWWGPNGFTNEFSRFEFKPGGLWTFVMRGPNGHGYPNESRFVELVRPERIVLEHIVVPFYRNTMTFKDRSGKTELSWHAVFQTADENNEKFKAFIVEKNEENFDRLEACLKTLAGPGTAPCFS
jgi:uncharacterized protein YndB with AHSA1/START domain